MRKDAVVALLAAGSMLLLAACGGGESTDPVEASKSPYSGAFDLDYAPLSSTCSAVLPEEHLPLWTRVVVTGPVIQYGDIFGSWSEQDRRGTGTGPETCIPIPSIDPDCVRCFEIAFDIVYADPDSFGGTVEIAFDGSAQCGSQACRAEFGVTGVRR